ncbi:hypothetical protein DPQ25_03845 [Hydrogeniiclostridium mannosilyticum]|uniref:Uncharacterized protein n=1 Tax=Hydrogeniiclostridium mannosilyticum TaxID=2764322 RepID=A0A328UH30_9FIRM|nr:hypothetical protein DPQ25_03845 [Hydrogeniiclostridium mannosilyticum]
MDGRHSAPPFLYIFAILPFPKDQFLWKYVCRKKQMGCCESVLHGFSCIKEGPAVSLTLPAPFLLFKP